jgi:hypothetical protein
MPKDDATPARVKWAQFRFSVVGALLAAPPKKGDLRAQLAALASKTWRHPITGEPYTPARSTIERWYYEARSNRDPVTALARAPCARRLAARRTPRALTTTSRKTSRRF